MWTTGYYWFWHTAISSLKNHMTIQVWGTLWPYGSLAWFPGSAGVFRRQFDPDGTSKSATFYMILDHYFKKHGQNDRVECVELKHQVSCISIPLAIEGWARPHAAITCSSNLSWEDETWRRCAWNCYWRFENCWKKQQICANLVNFQLAETCGPASGKQEQKPRKTAESADLIGFYG